MIVVNHIQLTSNILTPLILIIATWKMPLSYDACQASTGLNAIVTGVITQGNHICIWEYINQSYTAK